MRKVLVRLIQKCKSYWSCWSRTTNYKDSVNRWLYQTLLFLFRSKYIFSQLFCRMKLNISTNCNIRCVFLFILQMTWIRLWDQEWDCETKTGTVRPIFGLWDQYLDCVTKTGTVRPRRGLWDQDWDWIFWDQESNEVIEARPFLRNKCKTISNIYLPSVVGWSCECFDFTLPRKRNSQYFN